MKHAYLVWSGAIGVAAAVASPAAATFHLMQIQQVIGGVDGDAGVQAIQLRMRAGGQCFLNPARLWVRDAAGLNPVLLFDFSVCPAGMVACVPNCTTGRTVLLTTADFGDYVDSPIPADFILTNTIPASYLAAGSLTFESSSGTVYWRLSWGGAGYTGSNAGNCANDDSVCPAPGDFGPPWPGPLPSTGLDALLFQGTASALSTTNAADYAQTTGGAVFRNNAGQSEQVVGAVAPCPWDCDGSADGVVSTADFNALLIQWGMVGGTCDFPGTSPGVSTADFNELLSHWGGCP